MSEAIMEDEQAGDQFEADLSGAPDQSAEPEVDEFKAKVLEGGDYAWEQLVKRDQQFSKAQTKLKGLEPIEQLVNFAGGTNELLELAQLGTRIQQSPELAELVRKSLETGRVELPQAAPSGQSEEDEWIDPDTKKVRDELRNELAALKQELGSLSQIAGAADVRSKEQRVKANIEAALEEFSADPEAYKEASETVLQQYKVSLAAAERGDPAQARLIDQLAGPGGSSILETATMPIYKKYARKLLAASDTTTTNGGTEVLRKSTDERHTNPTRPGAQQLPPSPKGRVSDAYVLEVLQAAARKKGINLGN